jgi:uncharacterized protein (DUF433 family)
MAGSNVGSGLAASIRQLEFVKRYAGSMADICTEISSNPDVLGGAPVFRGTRVPVKALLDYLEGGHPLGEFLEDFPGVTELQAVAVLEHA